MLVPALLAACMYVPCIGAGTRTAVLRGVVPGGDGGRAVRAQPWEDADWKYPPSLAAPQQILTDASNGASDYGNKFGEPVVAGDPPRPLLNSRSCIPWHDCIPIAGPRRDGCWPADSRRAGLIRLEHNLPARQGCCTAPPARPSCWQCVQGHGRGANGTLQRRGGGGGRSRGRTRTGSTRPAWRRRLPPHFWAEA